MAFTTGAYFIARNDFLKNWIVHEKHTGLPMQNSIQPSGLRQDLEQHFRFGSYGTRDGEKLANPAADLFLAINSFYSKRKGNRRGPSEYDWDPEIHHKAILDDTAGSHSGVRVISKIRSKDEYQLAMSTTLKHISIVKLPENFNHNTLGDIIWVSWQDNFFEVYYFSILDLSTESVNILREFYEDPEYKLSYNELYFCDYRAFEYPKNFGLRAAKSKTTPLVGITNFTNQRLSFIIAGVREIRAILSMLQKYVSYMKEEDMNRHEIHKVVVRWIRSSDKDPVPQLFVILKGKSDHHDLTLINSQLWDPIFTNSMAVGMPLALTLSAAGAWNRGDLPVTNFKAEYYVTEALNIPDDQTDLDEMPQLSWYYQSRPQSYDFTGRGFLANYEITITSKKEIQLEFFSDGLKGQPLHERLVRISQVYFESWTRYLRYMNIDIIAEQKKKYLRWAPNSVNILSVCDETHAVIQNVWRLHRELESSSVQGEASGQSDPREIPPVKLDIFFLEHQSPSRTHNDVIAILLGTIEIGGVAMMLNNYPAMFLWAVIDRILVTQTENGGPISVSVIFQTRIRIR
ncbi:hypothetical protein TWF481_000214 [Arthrobotrys musiformis]|uniref:Uncharacterized protein n=1 Tax=Arthrobotrys musiformis TaxID=47236 RepID=A0AAV9WM04_9PEZI